MFTARKTQLEFYDIALMRKACSQQVIKEQIRVMFSISWPLKNPVQILAFRSTSFHFSDEG